MDNDLNSAGVYKLTCQASNKVYIGKAINFRKRLNHHKHSERKTKTSSYLEHAIIKYGWKSFTFEILETILDFDKTKDNDNLLVREAFYINLFNSTNPDKGYNICKYSTDRTGIPCSEDTKEKLRYSQIGRPKSLETREKLRQANLGKKMSKESRDKMRISKLGTTISEEIKEKISLSTIGRSKSLETREKMRQANLGRKHSEEHIEKNRQANLGRKLSDEHKEKLRQSALGRRHSEESKRKMVENRYRKNDNGTTTDNI